MTTTFKKLINNGRTRITEDIDDSALAFTVTTGGGATKLPSSGSFWATIGSEIMLCASVSVDTVTVTTRGDQGTSAAAHLAGTVVEVRFTEEHHSDITTAINAVETTSHTQNTDTGLGALSTKNPPVDADKAVYRDSTAADALVTSTWTQIKAFLKTYFDGLYNLYVHPNHSGDVTSVADGAQTIANKQSVTLTAPLTTTQAMTVIAAATPTVSMPAATALQDGYATSTQIDKLDNIEASADVTDTDNVTSAGAIMKTLLTEQGDIIYATAASTPAALPHSTAGYILQTGGNGANPSWVPLSQVIDKMRQQIVVPVGYNTRTAGSGTVAVEGGALKLSTTTTANSFAQAMIPGELQRLTVNTWTKRLIAIINIARNIPNVDCVVRVHFRTDFNVDPGGFAGHGLGFRIANLALYGESRGTDGTTEVVDLSTNLVDGVFVQIMIDFQPGTGIYWYVNDVLVGSQLSTTDIPSTTSAFWYVFNCSIVADPGVVVRAYIPTMLLFQEYD